MKKYKVIQWGTGQVGAGALRSIIEHPQLELVGVAAYSESKNGVDAGDLCGLPTTGIKATTDRDYLLSLDADCVNFNASAFSGDPVIDELEKILLSGKNIASTALLKPSVNNPGRGGDADVVKRFAAACNKTGVSYLATGLDPGFVTDVLPAVMSSMCSSIDHVHVTEVVDYSQCTFAKPQEVLAFMGFGRPLISKAPKFIGEIWIPAIHSMADVLGYEVEKVEVFAESAPLLADYEVFGETLKKGTSGALRFYLQGYVKGEPLLKIEHVTRIDASAAPDWQQPPADSVGYYVNIGGDLSYRLTLEFSKKGGSFMEASCWATGTRLVNAIPEICEAESGVLSVADIAIPTSRDKLL